jgi:ABC-type sugar transport system ATPase subunit
VSSEIEEVVEVSDRVLVLAQGRLVRDVEVGSGSEMQQILSAAFEREEQS